MLKWDMVNRLLYMSMNNQGSAILKNTNKSATVNPGSDLANMSLSLNNTCICFMATNWRNFGNKIESILECLIQRSDQQAKGKYLLVLLI